MKNISAAILAFTLLLPLAARAKTIALNKPQLKKGNSIMQALSERKSTREFDAKELDMQTLSNLLWAANGINRPDGKRTNPTAMNRQEIDVYACLKDGAYLYNAPKNELLQVTQSDFRVLGAPVTLVIVANVKELRNIDFMDAGIVSQNISLFASGTGLVTVARAQMPQDMAKHLALTEGQHLMLNHPVGFPKGKK